MAVKRFDIMATKEVTLKSDTENPTVWIIRRINKPLWQYIQDKYNQWSVNNLGGDAQGTVSFQVWGKNHALVCFGLAGWRNLLDDAGNEVVFSDVSIATEVGNQRGLSDRMLDMIRPYMGELASAIEAFNGVTEEERKN